MRDKPTFPWHWVVLAILVLAGFGVVTMLVALDARVGELIESGEQTHASLAWSIAIQEVLSKIVTALLPMLLAGGIVTTAVRCLRQRINLI